MSDLSQSIRTDHDAQVTPADSPAADPEVLAKPKRRRFTAKYKLSIVAEADACTTPGSLGALLRREGLYSSQVTKWRRLLAAGALSALVSRKRGPQKQPANPLQKDVKRLERENRALTRKLEKAELVIDFQKKFAAMLAAVEEESDNSQ